LSQYDAVTPTPPSRISRSPQRGLHLPRPRQCGACVAPGEVAIDNDCPVHGLAASARDRAGEAGLIDTEGDIVDKASDPELRRS